MKSYTFLDPESLSDRTSSPELSIFSTSPLSDGTIESPRSMSPTEPLPQGLARTTKFIPIDRDVTKRISSPNMRPVFENPRPAPSPPLQARRPSSFPSKTALDTEYFPVVEHDICDEAEDFLRFLSKAGFMAADKRSSLCSSTSTSPHRQDTRPIGDSTLSTISFELHRPSANIVDSRRTSLAARRCSSGVLPPVFQEATVVHPSPIKPLEQESLAMKRESTLSKFVATLRMSSDFTLPHHSMATMSTNPDVDDVPIFQAQKASSVDFDDIEILLAQERNPILTQLHKTYAKQFASMASQIDTLTRELAEMKQSQHNSQYERPINVFERQISLDVASTIRSETPAQCMSRQFPKSRSQFSVENPREVPFWKTSLQEEGEEWDTGMEEWRRESLRCISPMTTY